VIGGLREAAASGLLSAFNGYVGGRTTGGGKVLASAAWPQLAPSLFSTSRANRFRGHLRL
jgi:hypothetical protein